MMRLALRALLAALLSTSTMLGSGPPAARAQDVCPEPNNSFQNACYLGPGADAVGFLQQPGDTDAYRIEVLDFNVDIHVELAERPFPYRLELANWNGDPIATSDTGVIDTTLDMPGSYYIFVDSPSGQISASRPYRIFRQLSYPGAKIPDIVFSYEFRAGTPATTGDNQFAVYSSQEGRYTISMKLSGTPEDPSQAWWTGWGPELTDFTLVVDSRVVNDVDAGFQVFFRFVDDANNYFVTIDARDGNVALSKNVNGEAVRLAGWVQSPAVDTGGGVNRVAVHCVRDRIVVVINGDPALEANDGSFRKGMLGFGAIAWAAPPVVNFDNVIVTTPAEGLGYLAPAGLLDTSRNSVLLGRSGRA